MLSKPVYMSVATPVCSSPCVPIDDRVRTVHETEWLMSKRHAKPGALGVAFVCRHQRKVTGSAREIEDCDIRNTYIEHR